MDIIIGNAWFDERCYEHKIRDSARLARRYDKCHALAEVYADSDAA